MVQWRHHRGDLAQREAVTAASADVWESERPIWTESRYRELYLGDQPFPPGWTRL